MIKEATGEGILYLYQEWGVGSASGRLVAAGSATVGTSAQGILTSRVQQVTLACLLLACVEEWKTLFITMLKPCESSGLVWSLEAFVNAIRKI